MIVLIGKKLNLNNSVFYSLTNIYGIGYSQSLAICKSLGLSKNVTFSVLSLRKRKKLQDLLQNMLLGTSRFHDKLEHINLLKEINTYRG
tara:strand:+ start:93 stop:359 length:267 start_codon:yes stop_codon:yes gene_type:complete